MNHFPGNMGVTPFSEPTLKKDDNRYLWMRQHGCVTQFSLNILNLVLCFMISPLWRLLLMCMQVMVTVIAAIFLPWWKTSAMWERCHVGAPILLHYQRMAVPCGHLEEGTMVRNTVAMLILWLKRVYFYNHQQYMYFWTVHWCSLRAIVHGTGFLQHVHVMTFAVSYKFCEYIV